MLDECCYAVVMAQDNLTMVVSGNTLYIGDANTNMKAVVERVSKEAPETL